MRRRPRGYFKKLDKIPKYTATIGSDIPYPYEIGDTELTYEYPMKYIQHSTPEKEDIVNHPPHYTQGSIETIDIIENTIADFESYLLGNIIKYLTRYPHKNGIEDLKKAQWYLTRLIECMEAKEV